MKEKERNLNTQILAMDMQLVYFMQYNTTI